MIFISNETNQSTKTRLVFLGESEINEKQRPHKWMEGCRNPWFWVVENLGVLVIFPK